MSVKNCEKSEKSMVALTVEVSAADFETAIEKAYRKQRGRIQMPGFRPGKAPRKMIESMYGPQVFYEEAVNIALPDAYEAAVKEQELNVVGYPQVELLDVGKEGFSFKATVAVYPEVTLGQYKGLEIPRAEVKVSAADVTARLKEMAERNSRMASVDRPVEKGDTANIDFEGFDHGVPFDGGKGEDHDLEIGSDSFVPGFEDQLIGMSAGEEKDIDITFPENYHESLAGKAVVFHVKVNAVKVKEVPAIDDEFAKDVSEFDTLAELKKDVKAKLTAEREEAAKQAFEDIAMEKVAEGITADIPDAMVDEQAAALVENFKRQVQSQGISYEQYLKMTGVDEKAMAEQAHEPALRQVRMDLALAAVIKAEGIEAADEDVEAEYARMAKQYGMEADQLKKYIDAGMVREQVLRSKAIAVVVDSAVAVKPAEDGEEKPKAKKTAKKAKKAEDAETAENVEAPDGETAPEAQA